tara:strand:+ start:1591 stop:1848 length:258 start_codon:yes stop_codon:yes gene_type:complete
MEDINTSQLDEEIMQLYQEMFRMIIDKCTSHSSIAVAGTMIGLAMRLYRTALDDNDYNQMMDYISTNTDLIEPFSLLEFESPTVH